MGREDQSARHLPRIPCARRMATSLKPGGLVRWLSLAMAVLPGLFAKRRWALPFLTVLALSARWSETQGRRHKTPEIDRARQAILQSKRWLADRSAVVVADSSFAALELIAAVRRHVCPRSRGYAWMPVCSNRRPERRLNQKGRPRLKGKALPKLCAILAGPKTVWTRITMTECARRPGPRA